MHNGVGPMPKTKALLADKGATATNWFSECTTTSKKKLNLRSSFRRVAMRSPHADLLPEPLRAGYWQVLSQPQDHRRRMHAR